MSKHPVAAPLSSLKTPPPQPTPARMEHALRYHRLLSNHWAKQGHHSLNSAVLFAQQPQVWQEIAQIQQAVWQQTFKLQQNWMNDWNTWIGEFNQMKKANTMSKMLEQEFNVLGLFMQLIQNQTTDWVSLLERIEINYGYWLNEKINADPSTL